MVNDLIVMRQILRVWLVCLFVFARNKWNKAKQTELHPLVKVQRETATTGSGFFLSLSSSSPLSAAQLQLRRKRETSYSCHLVSHSGTLLGLTAQSVSDTNKRGPKTSACWTLLVNLKCSFEEKVKRIKTWTNSEALSWKNQKPLL